MKVSVPQVISEQGGPTLEELATLAAAGDRAALEALLAEIQPRVRRICGRMLIHP